MLRANVLRIPAKSILQNCPPAPLSWTLEAAATNCRQLLPVQKEFSAHLASWVTSSQFWVWGGHPMLLSYCRRGWENKYPALGEGRHCSKAHLVGSSPNVERESDTRVTQKPLNVYCIEKLGFIIQPGHTPLLWPSIEYVKSQLPSPNQIFTVPRP